MVSAQQKCLKILWALNTQGKKTRSDNLYKENNLPDHKHGVGRGTQINMKDREINLGKIPGHSKI